MATVSRLVLAHPALGAAGGASLHASVEALYQKIGDAVANRWYQLTDFDQTETVDLEHNFDTDIENLRWDIYVFTGGQWVLLSDTSSPLRSAFTVIEKVGFEDITLQITNVSGGNDLLAAVVVTNDPLALEDGDIKDVNVAGAQDGQALVYVAATDDWRPGASGDSSYKLQSVTTPNLSLKGGYLALIDGRELATYSGSGTVLASYGVDLTLNLTTILGGAPADATNYYLYLDLTTLGAVQTISDTGRKVYRIVQANFFLSTVAPETVLTLQPNRYVPIGNLLSATTGNAWSGAGSAFTTYSSKKHDNGPAWDQTVAPEDGQALVYDTTTGRYKPGASGDSSFKLQTMAANVGTVKAGSIFLDDGKELYLAADATFNFKTAVNTLGVTAPGATTAYYVYLDLAFLPAQTTVGTSDRKVYAVASGTSGMFVVLATRPEVTDLARYVPLYSIKTDGSSNYVAGNFANLAVRRHQLPAVNVSPMVYEDADHSIGTVGSAGQLATYGQLGTADFPTPASAHVYSLDTNSNDANGTPLNLTQNGTPTFNGVGLFGKENVVQFDGIDDNLSSSNAAFNVTTGSFTMGGWFAFTDWHSTVQQGMMGKYNNPSNFQYLLYYDTDLAIKLNVSSNGTANTTLIAPLLAGFDRDSYHHVVAQFDNPSNLIKIFIDGQLAASAAFASDLFSGNANFRVGTFENGGTPMAFYKGKAQDLFFTSEVLTASQINVIMSKRFKGQQIAGGHALATDSFPLTSLSGKIGFYNLSANANDGSVNAANLTNTGSTPFTGLGLFGAADAAAFDGTNHDFQGTGAFFNPGNAMPFAIGGWFNMNDWSPSAERTLIAVGDSTQSYLAIWAEDATKLRAAINISAGTVFQFIDFPSTALIDGSWHHVAASYVGRRLTFWVDGLPVNTIDTTLNWTIGAGTSTLRIGNWLAGAQRWAGRASNCFYAKGWEPTTQDIQKLVSAVITPTSTVRTQDQDWKVNYLSESGQVVNELSDSGLVDKDDTKAWFFFGGGSPNRANIRLYDQGLGAATVPVRKYDKQFTATPATTLAHGLPSMPTDIVILHNQLADGKYVNVAPDFSPKADGTNIYVNLASLTIDATHDVRIVASIGVPAIGVAKSFKTVTTTYTASVGDRLMTDSSGGAFTITLPPTPAFGDEIEVFDATESWVPFNVTLARNGSNINGVAADFICNVDNGKVRLVYFNTAQGWRVYP